MKNNYTFVKEVKEVKELGFNNIFWGGKTFSVSFNKGYAFSVSNDELAHSFDNIESLYTRLWIKYADRMGALESLFVSFGLTNNKDFCIILGKYENKQRGIIYVELGYWFNTRDKRLLEIIKRILKLYNQFSIWTFEYNKEIEL